MKVRRILLVCVFALVFVLALTACAFQTHKHTVVIDNAVAATCKETGLTAGAHCSECGEILIAQSEVSLKAHTYDDKYDAFCNVCGYKRDVECLHTELETIPGKSATCKEEGLTDGKRCAKCGEIIIAQTIIPKNENHNFINNVCERCGEMQESVGLAYEVIDDNTCYISGIGSCTDLDIKIPTYIDGYKVTSIGDEAFDYCRSLTSIVIPDSVTSIGGSAFYGCNSLTSVTIGNGVVSIGELAFYGCSGLTSIVIPDSVTSIGDYAFFYCYSLTSIVIPDSVMSIDYGAFQYCSSLESIIVENGNTVYHSSGNCLIETATKTLIAGCKNSVIPTDGSVTSIGTQAFYNCSSLTNIVIPDSVTSIGDSAFDGCSSLTSVVIPDSVTSIGECAFAACSSLTSITYTGTAQQWASVTKGFYWKYNVPVTEVVCSDTTVAL